MSCKLLEASTKIEHLHFNCVWKLACSGTNNSPDGGCTQASGQTGPCVGRESQARGLRRVGGAGRSGPEASVRLPLGKEAPEPGCSERWGQRLRSHGQWHHQPRVGGLTRGSLPSPARQTLAAWQQPQTGGRVKPYLENVQHVFVAEQGHGNADLLVLCLVASWRDLGAERRVWQEGGPWLPKGEAA